MEKTIKYIGLDVHKNSIAIAIGHLNSKLIVFCRFRRQVYLYHILVVAKTQFDCVPLGLMFLVLVLVNNTKVNIAVYV